MLPQEVVLGWQKMSLVTLRCCGLVPAIYDKMSRRMLVTGGVTPAPQSLVHRAFLWVPKAKSAAIPLTLGFVVVRKKVFSNIWIF